MPELPEVETVRRGLEPAMAGAVFVAVETRRKDLRFPLPANFARRLEGARVETLGRRGKYLTAALSSGETLVMHLGMTEAAAGSGPLDRAARPDPAHDHVSFWMKGPGGKTRIDYNDPRRFGFMDLVETATIDSSAHFGRMGPEPLSRDFTANAFREALKRRSAPLKAALLDQSVVAGLGNIYVCEALFEARLSPRRRASSLTGREADRLHSAICVTLAAAIEAGGSTLRDFAGSDGSLGYFQHRFRVYDREGEACPACAGPVSRIVQSGRSTFYCRKCQRQAP
ncbi:MAG: bifunctional DNA-formamidopyrimidine glycosylase/DNA-(apurinic or apyrimidinic site) lyase [Pseudomonadota bacterium]